MTNRCQTFIGSKRRRIPDMTQITLMWTWLAAKVRLVTGHDEEGSVVEKVILTAIFAALALAVGAIIVSKVMAKANSVNLN
jgi:hypothetical protein